MGDPRKCCILGICCPPPEQIAAIASLLTADGMDQATATRAATCLAPHLRKGSREIKATEPKK